METNLTALKGVGPAVASQLAAIGLHTVMDLLDYVPRDHHDYSIITEIAHLRPGMATIRATFTSVKGHYVRRGMHITEGVASDKSGSIKTVWFNQAYRETGTKLGAEYFITGKLEFKAQRFSISNPHIELVSDTPVHTARIVPIYRESRGVSTMLLRKLMAQAIRYCDQFPDIIPKDIQNTYNLLPYGQAIKQLHFPESAETLAAAKYSLAFIEIFELMLAAQINKNLIAGEVAPKIAFDEDIAKKFVASLPFTLTDAQRKAVWQVFNDIAEARPMNRLVEGDVGSGKTIVAAMAAVMAMQAGYQVALLAPTELLARQHADTVTELLRPLSFDNGVSLLVGSQKTAQKAQAREHIAKGRIRLMIGTHALLQESVVTENLGLIIVDEQHRFGVEQRKKLLKNGNIIPHVLSMTATPIPRSLALTLYGELDISLLDAMPPGRKPIITTIISPNSRDKMNAHIQEEIAKGHQIYIVCPLIKEGGIKTVSAEQMYEQLRLKTFKKARIGLLHGKLKAADKEDVMRQFVEGKLDILVATTVIEVGVNVPAASIMVIEGADRFGLAQMHQLRGRVGRSTDQGYCYIVPSDSKAPSKRLRALAQSTDGFRLAELDLELRGPGAIYGTMQHGELDLRFATLTDSKLLSAARDAVQGFIKSGTNLKDYPILAARVRTAQAVVTLN